MNPYRPAYHLSNYTSRITCAALWIAGINGYIFTNQHPDLVFKLALYGSLCVLASLIILTQITRQFTDRVYSFRNSIITTAVMCWALPGILLTPPAHYDIVITIGIIFFTTMIITTPLLSVLTDRHDWKHRHDDDEYDPTTHMPAAELMENDR